MNHKGFITLLLLVILSAVDGYTQNGERLHQLKTYINFEPTIQSSTRVTDTAMNVTTRTSESLTEYGRLTFSYALRTRKGNVHELELNRLRIWNRNDRTTLDNGFGEPTTVAGAENRGVQLAFRYEFMHKLHEFGGAHPLSVYLGESSIVSFVNASNRPHNSHSFLTKDNMVAMDIGIVPRITCDLTDRLFVDLNLPLNLMSLSYEENFVDNPSFTAEQKRSNLLTFKIHSELMLRAGIGIRI